MYPTYKLNLINTSSNSKLDELINNNIISDREWFNYKKYYEGTHPPFLKPLTKFNPLYSLYNSPIALKISSNPIDNLTKNPESKYKYKYKYKSLLDEIEQTQKRKVWLKMNRFILI
jgi:hypothetical protein